MQEFAKFFGKTGFTILNQERSCAAKRPRREIDGRKGRESRLGGIPLTPIRAFTLIKKYKDLVRRAAEGVPSSETEHG